MTASTGPGPAPAGAPPPDVARTGVVLSAAEARNIARLLAGVASFVDHGPARSVDALTGHLRRYGAGEAPLPRPAGEDSARFRALIDVYRWVLDPARQGEHR
jgi:hypothetical protein